MVAKGYGKSDSDKVGKEKSDKPMLKASAVTGYTGRIGGPANTPARPGGKTAGVASTYKRGGSVKRGR